VFVIVSAIVEQERIVLTRRDTIDKQYHTIFNTQRTKANVRRMDVQMSEQNRSYDKIIILWFNDDLVFHQSIKIPTVYEIHNSHIDHVISNDFVPIAAREAVFICNLIYLNGSMLVFIRHYW